MEEVAYGIQPQGYRLPEATHIGAVTLQVSDLARSTRFYRDVLGFGEVSTSNDRVELGVDDKPLVVLQAGAKEPLKARRLGLYHFAILLPDRPSLGRVLEHLVDNGIRPGASDHLVSEALYIDDPDGLGIEIYRDRPREEWTVTGKQLDMATDPLDFEAVVAAGGNVKWSGMPSGTTIGHVHLHVGNIEDAKRFYHEAVGLDVMVWSYPGALFLSAGGYHHHLGTNTWAGPHATPPQRDEPRLAQWQLVLPGTEDVARVAANIHERGYSVTPEEPGGSIAIDPWTTPLQFTTYA
jgi:catechol 2,3-dioxygenase